MIAGVEEWTEQEWERWSSVNQIDNSVGASTEVNNYWEELKNDWSDTEDEDDDDDEPPKMVPVDTDDEDECEDDERPDLLALVKLMGSSKEQVDELLTPPPGLGKSEKQDVENRFKGTWEPTELGEPGLFQSLVNVQEEE